MTQYIVAALYKFVTLDDFEALKTPLEKVCKDNGVMGTILLASEGINGTISGSRQGIDAVLNWINTHNKIGQVTHKESFADKAPFYRMKVRLKKEIVTMGVPEVRPSEMAGTYVKPDAWNDLIADPEVIVVDTRNDYEVSIGTFKGALNPETTAFREFPKWVEEKLEADKDTKVAMFCTGGIRCEKSTAYLKAQGYKNVFHLEGGILKYLEEVPKEESLWEGECFVFDQRVSVGHGLKPGPYDLCHACRHPISEADKKADTYTPGVSCPNCFDEHSPQQKQRFADRQKQMELARQRGEPHIAVDITAKKAEKKQQREEHVLRSNKPRASKAKA